MNTELITRLIGLIEKTGDKVVLADPLTGKAVVVMDLDAYERLNAGNTPAVAAARPAKAVAREKDTYIEDAEWGAGRYEEARRKHEDNGNALPSQPQVGRGSRLKAVDELRPARQLKAVLAEKAAVADPTSPDLTQEELLDKINREIGAWKNAQEKKRTAELQSAAQTITGFQTIKAFEEEERFYLEPIE